MFLTLIHCFSDVHNTITLKLHSSAFLTADVSEECDLSAVTCDDTSFRYNPANKKTFFYGI